MNSNWVWKILEVRSLPVKSQGEIFLTVRALSFQDNLQVGYRIKAEIGTRTEVLAPLELFYGTISVKNPVRNTIQFEVLIENQYRGFLKSGLFLKPRIGDQEEHYPRPHTQKFSVSWLLKSWLS